MQKFRKKINQFTQVQIFFLCGPTRARCRLYEPDFCKPVNLISRLASYL